ncbi:MAG: NAD(P)-binding domain-containing protein [Pseudoflavonifractor sp.]|nr:NAD(P)-binding domain-containing protein [Alloprevotella sp.]MCM1117367.1 NAD(P)-binding domain-containing protein [Pseudoflavonifractor sp.]
MRPIKIAIIGVGAMGGAIVDGLLRSGFQATDLFLANPHTERLAPYREMGATVTDDNSYAARRADVIILAVKPWLIAQVAGEIAQSICFKEKTIISVAATVTGKALCDLFPDADEIAIAIPNTAAALCSSMTFVTPVKGTASEATGLFMRVGAVEHIDEAHLPAAMTVASCGIAFAMRYVRAAMEGAVEIGLKASMAQKIICHTIEGAADLLLRPGSHPEAEIDKVTTPGGLTIRGLNAMEAEGFTPAVIAAHRAAMPK